MVWSLDEGKQGWTLIQCYTQLLKLNECYTTGPRLCSTFMTGSSTTFVQAYSLHFKIWVHLLSLLQNMNTKTPSNITSVTWYVQYYQTFRGNRANKLEFLSNGITYKSQEKRHAYPTSIIIITNSWNTKTISHLYILNSKKKKKKERKIYIHIHTTSLTGKQTQNLSLLLMDNCPLNF